MSAPDRFGLHPGQRGRRAIVWPTFPRCPIVRGWALAQSIIVSCRNVHAAQEPRRAPSGLPGSDGRGRYWVTQGKSPLFRDEMSLTIYHAGRTASDEYLSHHCITPSVDRMCLTQRNKLKVPVSVRAHQLRNNVFSPVPSRNPDFQAGRPRRHF